MLSTAGLKGDSTKLSNNRITKKGAKFINPTLVMRGKKRQQSGNAKQRDRNSEVFPSL